jgi:hypothetical protein
VHDADDRVSIALVLKGITEPYPAGGRYISMHAIRVR